MRALDLNEETTVQVCGNLGQAKGFNDHRNPRNSGLHAALAERRSATDQLLVARGHLDAAVEALKLAAATNGKSEEHIATSVTYGGNAIDGLYAYAGTIGIEGLPSGQAVAIQDTSAA